MKTLLNYLILLYLPTLMAQTNTNIYLFDLNKNEVVLSQVKAISNSEGYNNQPYFLDNNTLFYAANRKGQTDIARHTIAYGFNTWFNYTADGSEYSPKKIPNQHKISAVQLKPDGTQTLRAYSLSTGDSDDLISNVVIGYYEWYNAHSLVAATLKEGISTLTLTDYNLQTNTYKEVANNVGRSLHRIPNSNAISFISKAANVWQIKSYNPNTGAISLIAETVKNSEDLCWFPNGDLIMSSGNKLFLYQPQTQNSWQEIADVSDLGITNLSRLAVSPDGTTIAVVAEGNLNTAKKQSPKTTKTTNQSPTTTIRAEKAMALVNAHIEPYNKADLNFVKTFDKAVVVSRFPQEKLFEGRDAMRTNYAKFFKDNTQVSVLVNNQMVLGNKVINSEISTVNHGSNRLVAIYEVGDDSIKALTFLNNSKTDTNPETIVDAQLEAYNKKDLEAYLGAYANTIKIYNYPAELATEGTKQMRATYKAWFSKTPDLYAKVLKRFVLGNKVIDKLQVVANKQIIEAIGIYEVSNGKITKVTYLR